MVTDGLPYGSVSYWDQRYARASDADFDADEWYGGPGVTAVLAAVAALNLPPTSPVLEVGCGGGRLADLLASSSTGLVVTATDLSAVAVERRRARAAAGGAAASNAPTFAVADATALPFPDASLSLLIDKGTLDALDCGENGPSQAALAEGARVLRPGGFLVLASCRDPAARAPLVDPLFETVAVAEVWADVDGATRRGPCPEAYVYTLAPRCVSEAPLSRER